MHIKQFRWKAAVATAVVAAAATGTVLATRGAPATPVLAAASVNSLWDQANNFAFKDHPTPDRWRLYRGVAQATPDEGIVFFRVFIPAELAAGGLLAGDNRGFSPEPKNTYRAVVAWNTRNGDVSLTVDHSVALAPLPVRTRTTKAALPIASSTDWATAFAANDQRRSDNRIGINADSKSRGLHARISLLNPETNSSVPWSVDHELTLTRNGPGDYRLALEGNGYPAIEAYYYPKYQSGDPYKVIAKRKVSPVFQVNAVDGGGGLAARDDYSWNKCEYKDSEVFRCRNIRAYTGVPWGRNTWTAWWETKKSDTAAL